MRQTRNFVFILLTIFFIGPLSAQNLEANVQFEGKYKKSVRKNVSFNYLVYLPENYSKSAKLPLILFLHGSGERGDSLELVKKQGPPKVAENMKLPFIVISPQCPEGIWWDVEALKYFLDHMIKKYHADKHRIYLTGLSMGGYAAWEMGWKYPDCFAAIAPVCGGGNPHRVCNMKDVPVWAFHGAKDDVVALEKGQEMVDAVKACGGNVKFTVYPESNHDSWTETYNNKELYEWLLQQKKN